MLPIAGAGHQAALWQERTVIGFIGVGSVASMASIAGVLVQWSWNG